MLRRATLMTLAMLSLTACPRGVTNDVKRSGTHLDLAIDAFGRRPPDLDVVEAEATKSIGFMSTNEEAYNVRGMGRMFRAFLGKASLEVDSCLTGLDADAVQAEIDEQYAAAAVDFQRASELAPDYAEAWFNRGNVALGQGDADTAVSMFQRALENPIRLGDATKARANLGIAHFEQGDMVSAAKELRQALQFQPNMCFGKFWLGRVYFAREEWDKAGELFAGIVEDPTCNSYQEPRLYLMKTRLAQGLIDDARAAKSACLTLSRVSCAAMQCVTEGNSL